MTCQNEKSQLQNKEAAFRVLKAKLYELEEQKRAEELAQLRGERMDSTFGSQIRNYVLYPLPDGEGRAQRHRDGATSRPFWTATSTSSS